MGEVIKPFFAVLFNPALNKDCSSLICPPYDAISPSQLKELRRKSRYNFSRIILADQGDYSACRNLLDEWIRKKILVVDKKESIYLYEQRFKVGEALLSRYGIIGLLDMNKQGILPHEFTHKEAREDRKKMIRAVEANLSPIFVISARRCHNLSEAYSFFLRRKPLIACRDVDGNLNRLWRVDDPARIRKLLREFKRCRLLIADGHHRFEVAYDYYKKNSSCFKNLNYLMAYITDLQPGLVILPTHRVVSGIPGIGYLKKCLGPGFELKATTRKELKKELFERTRLDRKPAIGAGEKCFFRCGVYLKGKYYILKLRDERKLDKIENKEFRVIDSAILQAAVLKPLGVGSGVEYTHSLEEAAMMAKGDKAAFILSPVSLKDVVKISDKGLRMPQKSTYFYPKLQSGLLVRCFNAD